MAAPLSPVAATIAPRPSLSITAAVRTGREPLLRLRSQERPGALSGAQRLRIWFRGRLSQCLMAPLLCSQVDAVAGYPWVLIDLENVAAEPYF